MTKFYSFARFILKGCALINGTRVYGGENVLKGSSQLIVCNHTSYGDPPLLAVAVPHEITFIAKGAFSKNFFTRKLFGALGAVFLDPSANDLAALRTSISLLKSGKTVAIFPEGTRHKDQNIGEFKQGAAFIASRAKVPVLPVAVVNCGDFFRFWKRNIIINIGKPVFAEIPARVDETFLAEQTKIYENAVTALFEEAVAQLQQEGKAMRKYN